MEERVIKLADNLHEKTVATRRELHKYPESAWTEFRTSSYVAQRLKELGYEVLIGEEILDPSKRPGLPDQETIESCWERALKEGADKELLEKMKGGLTGVVGLLKGSSPGPTIGLRFDIDANDLIECKEEDHRPYKEGFASVHDGACHACGHDAHTSIGLSVAEILSTFMQEFPGSIKLIFQPGEEGMRGAYPIVQKGILDDVDHLLGLHIGLKANKTGTLYCGSYGFQATSKINAVYKGRSSHAGLAPQDGKNALLAASAAVLNLHAIPRHSSGASRINVGYLQGGSGRNIVPETALLKLETRGVNTEINHFMEERAHQVLKGAAEMYDVELELQPMGGAPSGESDSELIRLIKEIALDMGEFPEVHETVGFGACEDYTFMMERVQKMGGKATFVVLGTDLASGHHHPRFDIDEKSLTQGVKLLSLATFRLLNKTK